MVEGVEFEEGLGNFIPLEKVSDAGLFKGIETLLDEAIRRKVRKELIEFLEHGTALGKRLAKKLKDT